MHLHSSKEDNNHAYKMAENHSLQKNVINSCAFFVTKFTGNAFYSSWFGMQANTAWEQVPVDSKFPVSETKLSLQFCLHVARQLAMPHDSTLQ